MQQWYYFSNGVQYGPVSWESLGAMASQGRLDVNDPIWAASMPAWQPAGSIPGLVFYARPTDADLKYILPIGLSGWAIAAGYLGLFSVIAIGAPFALLTGILALRDIKRDPKLGGKARAIFGIIMGVVFCAAYGYLAIVITSNSRR